MMKCSGSITVEITIIMTFLLGVFIFIFFSGFYIHDKCLITKACSSASLRSSEAIDIDEAYRKANEALEEVIPDKLLGKWSYSYSINVDKDQTSCKYDGSMLMTGGLLRNILSHDSMNYSCTSYSYRLDEATYIRTNKKSGVGY